MKISIVIGFSMFGLVCFCFWRPFVQVKKAQYHQDFFLAHFLNSLELKLIVTQKKEKKKKQKHPTK